MVLLIVILVVLMAGGGGFYGYRRQYYGGGGLGLLGLLLVVGLPFVWLGLRGSVRAVLTCYVAFVAVATGSRLAGATAVAGLAVLWVLVPPPPTILAPPAPPVGTPPRGAPPPPPPPPPGAGGATRPPPVFGVFSRPRAAPTR